MLLQKLVEYASDRIEQTPPLYGERPIRYVVELDADGNPLGITDTADPSDHRTRNGVRRLAPEGKRCGPKAPPILLADHAGYTLGLPVPSKKMSEEKAKKCFDAYTIRLERCAATTEEPAVAAVLHFLNNCPLNRLARPDDFDESASITFRVDGSFVIDLPTVQEFWAGLHSEQGSAEHMQCMVCGRKGPVLKTHPMKIKGIPGGVSDLVSADKPAFQSYGLKSSYNAPTCDACANLYIKALNELLDTKSNSYCIGGVAFVFWTRRETGFSIRSFFHRPDAEEVRALIASVQTGRRTEPDETEFYATRLIRTEARAVVLDWIDTTVGKVKGNLVQWFEMQRIVDWNGEERHPLGIPSLAAAIAPRKKGKPDMERLPISVPGDLLRTALTGSPLPHTLLVRVLDRNKAERRVTSERAALIKLVLMSQPNYDNKEDDMVSLNEEHPSPAYHCGRLLAELEAVQYEALGKVNANIVDKFYGTASTAPAVVFPVLQKGAMDHLSKIRKANPGAHYNIQERLMAILAHIPEHPKTLTPEEQGQFSLGYWHQKADAARRRKAGAEKKAEKNSTG